MNRKLRNTLLVALSLALVVWCIPAMGQVLKGSISGTVTDPQGAVVTGAQVKATHVATGGVYTTTSDNAGLFRINLIPSGTYKIEITAQGFKTTVENNISVSAGADQGLGTLKLQVGGTSETLEVTAAAPLVETTQAQVTNTFSGVTLQTFAGIQENEGLDNLALFVPGVTSVRDQGFSNTNGGGGFSSDGIRGRNNDQEIDGQNNNDNSVAGPFLFLSDTEWVGQYVLITNNFGPEYGRNAGSVVNIITKSGGNNWHGSLYGSENNSDLNSLTNFDKLEGITSPPRLNNEFGGGTIGGPLDKNHWFLFGGFNEDLVSTTGVAATGALTPTPAGLAQLDSCFPGSAGLAAYSAFGPYAISGGNPHVFGAITPVTVGACANVPFAGVERSLPQPTHDFDWTTRTDWQSGSDTAAMRYIFNRGNTFNNDFGQAAEGFPANVTGLSQAFLITETHNFSSRMVNEARASFGRLNVDFGGNSFGTMPTAAGLDNAVTNISFSGTNLLGLGPATNLPQSRHVNTFQLQDNWNYVLGKHSFKAGINWSYQQSPNIFLPDINGAYRFGPIGDASKGDSWASLVADVPTAIEVASGPSELGFKEYDTFAYVGDDWKIKQNLTLNLGLTWTFYGDPENLFHQITTAQQTSSNPFWNPALPLSVTTFPNVPSIYTDVGPSAGFAYNPHWGGWLTGNGKTTIRGGYRFLFDPPYYNIYINESTAAPEVLFSNPPNPGSFPMPAVPTGINVRNSLSSALQLGIFDPRTDNDVNVSPNFGPDKVNTWSLGIERELTKNSAFEVRYTGNHAYDLFQSANGNPYLGTAAAPGLAQVDPGAIPNASSLTACPATQQVGPGAGTDVGRVSCGTGVLLTRNNGGYSNYEGLQTEFRANDLFKQLTMRMSYTYAKNLDNVSEIFNTFAGGNTIALAQNPFNTGSGEYGYSGLNFPNTWTLLLTEQLPFFKEQHGFLGHVLGGWGFSGDYIIESGQGYTAAQGSGLAWVSDLLENGTNPYDFRFVQAFNSSVDVARPFLGSMSAPASAVGIYGADACFLFGTPGICALPANQLVTINSINQCQQNSSCNFATFTPATATASQVRYIMNGAESQSIFGTPFGAGRNLSTDAITNVANFSVLKTFKIGERASFQFRATMLNVFNHMNFQSIDPFVEDAGFVGLPGTGFGNPAVSNTIEPGSFAPATRQIFFGGTLRF